MIRWTNLVSLLTVLVSLAGCVELGLVPPPSAGDGDGSPGLNENSDQPPPAGDPPIVTLSASNTTPNLGEEVVLTCRQVGGDMTAMDGVRFDFQTTGRSLNVNALAGVARFVVDESDLNAAFSVSCSATNDAGTGASSNTLVILPTAAITP